MLEIYYQIQNYVVLIIGGCLVLVCLYLFFYSCLADGRLPKKLNNGQFVRMFADISRIVLNNNTDDKYAIEIDLIYQTESKQCFHITKNTIVTKLQVDQYTKEKKIAIKYEVNSPQNVELNIAQFRD